MVLILSISPEAPKAVGNGVGLQQRRTAVYNNSQVANGSEASGLRRTRVDVGGKARHQAADSDTLVRIGSGRNAGMLAFVTAAEGPWQVSRYLAPETRHPQASACRNPNPKPCKL